MDKVMQTRLIMAGLGALAGGSLYLLTELVERDVLPERLAFALVIFATVFFGAVLALSGPLRLGRVIAAAAGLAALVAVLLSWAGLRFATLEGVFNGPMHAMAAFALCTLPLPFIIAWHGAGLRDYPTLFTEAWGIIVRAGTAGVFAGLVWGVILLSDVLLGIVGLIIIDDLLDVAMVPWLITGVALGVALAVVEELRDFISPNLILRLVRLLVPVVLVVMVVFCAALPFQGFAGVFETLSAGATLLAMTAAGATLVSTAIDRNDAEAAQGAVMAWATRALAVILPVPAALAAFAIWLRVGQYGWTPERLFAALAAVVGLGYAVLYCASVLRQAGWMARVRQANIAMAVAVIGLSALWLTPVLNAERISANSQMARLAGGKLTAETVEPYTYSGWGFSGEALMAALNAKAAEPGQEALAQRLADGGTGVVRAEVAADDIRAALVAEMPLQPPTAAAQRDAILNLMTEYETGGWLDACRLRLPSGAPGCAMAFADILPDQPGDEAIVGVLYSENYGSFEAVFIREGGVERRTMTWMTGPQGYVEDTAGGIAALQAGVPAVRPVPMRMMSVGDLSLMPSP